MRKPSAIETNPIMSVTRPIGKLTILSVSPHEEDHLSLQSIVGHSKWMLFKAADLPSAQALLQEHRIAVVFCECDLTPGTWIDVLQHINALPRAPSLVVTSRLADDRLWSAVLNSGGWDVLAKPFDRAEVMSSAKSAWHHWYNQMRTPALTMKAAS